MSALDTPALVVLIASVLSLALLSYVRRSMGRYSYEHQGFRIQHARRPEVMMSEAKVHMRAAEDELENVESFSQWVVAALPSEQRAGSGQRSVPSRKEVDRELEKVRLRQEEIQRAFHQGLKETDQARVERESRILAYWDGELRKNRILGFAVWAAIVWSFLSLGYAVLVLWP